MTERKRTAAILVILFFTLSLIPSVGMLIFGGSKAGANEILASKPHITEKDGSFNSEFLSDLSDYFSDRFFLRQEAITLRNRLSTALFKTSPNSKVVLGRGDWLFYAETLNAAPLSEHELWCAAENLLLLQEAAESRGSEFLFVLCPNKSSLCPDELREGAPSADGRNFETLLSNLGVSHASLYDALYGKEELFYHTDSHWNAKGAAVAADTILAALNRDSSYADGPFSEGSGHSGDLSEMLYPASPDVETDYSYPFTFTYTSNYHAPNDPSITAEGGGEGSLTCYRDSFGNDLHPFLAESFSSSVFSRKTSFDLTDLEADTLIVELVERNIDYLYSYDHCYSAPERNVDISAAVEADPIDFTQSEAGELTRLSGEIGSYDNTPLYLLTEGKLYECAPKCAGFSICLPEFSGEAELIYQRNGTLYAAPLNIK